MKVDQFNVSWVDIPFQVILREKMLPKASLQSLYKQLLEGSAQFDLFFGRQIILCKRWQARWIAITFNIKNDIEINRGT
jgi:hypothetical protein